MRYRAFDVVIFDWDGTLVDSVEWIAECLQRAACDTGLPEPNRRSAKSVIGLGLSEALQTLFPGQCDDVLGRLVANYRERYLARQSGPSDLYEGVPETLEELRAAGISLAIATGKARKGLDRALRETELAHLFSATRCADETASKPDPKMLFELIGCLGVAKDRAVMIGDTTHDLQMASNAGIAAIAVTGGAHPREELAALQPWACLDAVRNLPGLLSVPRGNDSHHD